MALLLGTYVFRNPNLMKKYLLAYLLLLVLAGTAPGCYRKKLPETLKGRLEVKGPCGHITVSLVKGKLDPALIQPSWTDPNTGKSYSNVFAIANSCSFPSTELNEGDEFSFTLGGKPQNCMVCQVFYPTPEKSIAITVQRSPSTSNP